MLVREGRLSAQAGERVRIEAARALESERLAQGQPARREFPSDHHQFPAIARIRAQATDDADRRDTELDRPSPLLAARPAGTFRRQLKQPNSQILPGYSLIGELGQGGMGTVYRIRDDAGQDYALKIQLKAIGVSLKRFKRESQILQHFVHENIVGMKDFGVEDQLPYIIMELVEGEELGDWATREQKLSNAMPALPRLLEIIAKVADALDYCHARDLVHRDIKPSNILVGTAVSDMEPPVTLIDFGIARRNPSELHADRHSLSRSLTVEGTTLGTIHYMSPEQLDPGGEFGSFGPASDVYSLGATLFFCLTGRAPFEGEEGSSAHIPIIALMEDEAPLASALQPLVPPALTSLVARCLEKESGKRPTAARLAAALRSEEVLAQPMLSCNQRRALSYAPLVIGLVLLLWFWPRTPELSAAKRLSQQLEKSNDAEQKSLLVKLQRKPPQLEMLAPLSRYLKTHRGDELLSSLALRCLEKLGPPAGPVIAEFLGDSSGAVASLAFDFFEEQGAAVLGVLRQVLERGRDEQRRVALELLPELKGWSAAIPELSLLVAKGPEEQALSAAKLLTELQPKDEATSKLFVERIAVSKGRLQEQLLILLPARGKSILPAVLPWLDSKDSELARLARKWLSQGRAFMLLEASLDKLEEQGLVAAFEIFESFGPVGYPAMVRSLSNTRIAVQLLAARAIQRSIPTVVRPEDRNALLTIRAFQAIFTRQLRVGKPYTRMVIYGQLRNMTQFGLEAILPELNNPSPEHRAWAALAIPACLKGENVPSTVVNTAIAGLINHIEDKDLEVRWTVLLSLAGLVRAQHQEVNSPGVATAITKMLNDPAVVIRMMAADILRGGIIQEAKRVQKEMLSSDGSNLLRGLFDECQTQLARLTIMRLVPGPPSARLKGLLAGPDKMAEFKFNITRRGTLLAQGREDERAFLETLAKDPASEHASTARFELARARFQNFDALIGTTWRGVSRTIGHEPDSMIMKIDEKKGTRLVGRVEWPKPKAVTRVVIEKSKRGRLLFTETKILSGKGIVTPVAYRVCFDGDRMIGELAIPSMPDRSAGTVHLILEHSPRSP